MEISYTNANAGDVIAAVKAKYGDKMCVGAGTVMEAATARLAIMSGAEFVVANMESEEVARVCNLYQVPYAPGCTTDAPRLNKGPRDGRRRSSSASPSQTPMASSS
jgi:2-dehydro-3-deoxyphosphogluconate aldolase/(4S)-4-hydroxy-2-oxoglutarate aldolase